MKTKKAPKKTKVTSVQKKVRISPEFEKAAEIAGHYGFIELPSTSVEKEDILHAKKFSESTLKALHPFTKKCDRFSGYLEEKISLLRNYQDKKYADMSQPVTAYYMGPLKGNPHIKRTADEETFNLEIIGADKSINDAMLLEAAMVILKQRYPGEELCAHINSIGDRESHIRFARDLGNFFKKDAVKFRKECMALIKKDVFALFTCDHKECQEKKDRAPKPMSCLSEHSRTHFKEVLEYLESLEIPYTIEHELIGSRSYCSETIFEIRGKKDGKESVLAIGERYNTLAKKIWNKKDVPAIGIALILHPHFIEKKKSVKKPEEKIRFYFIPFGFDAKLKSLAVIESLRQSNIHVAQSLSKDKLSMQITYAEKACIPYILIMGQREAIEDSVVVRNVETREQNTVKIKDLAAFLRKLK